MKWTYDMIAANNNELIEERANEAFDRRSNLCCARASASSHTAAAFLLTSKYFC